MSNAVLQEIMDFHKALAASMPELSIPEPGLKLDLSTRKHDKTRLNRYIHRMCSLHSEHFAAAQQVKLLHLLMGYNEQVAVSSSYGLFFFARAILEMAAFMAEISYRISNMVIKEEKDLITIGEQFFSTIVRARYGTTNADMIVALQRESNISANCLKPFNITNCFQTLRKDTANIVLFQEYEYMCDFIHHNASSHFLSSNKSVQAHGFLNKSGGGVISSQPAPYRLYAYPGQSTLDFAVDRTSSISLQAAKYVVNTINQLVRGPIPPHLVINMTGSKNGF